VEWLRAHSDVGVLGSCIEHIDIAGKSLGSIDLTELEPRALRARFLFHNRLAQSSVMLRASELNARFRREFEPAEDYDLWSRLKCGLAVMGESLVRYRVHTQSVSATRAAAMLRAVAAIHAGELEKFGLRDSDHLHESLVAFDPIVSFDLFTRIERWLCTLREANQKNRCHEPEIFDRVLEARWCEVAGRAFQLGISGWKFWRNSVVHRASRRDDWRLFIRAIRQDLGRPFRQS
jgi:hypothetical protein